MATLPLLLILAAAGATLAPDTPLGRRLHAALIQRPAKALAGLSPRRALWTLVVALAVVVFLFAAPELVMVFGVGDFAAFLDLALIAVVATAVRRAREAVTALPSAFSRGRRPQPKPRARRPRRLRPPQSPANDDEPAPFRQAA